MNNIYNSQTIPSSVYNNKTQESFRNHNEKVNETWNKNHQYSKIGFEHRNFVSLNADPSIFPVSQMHILEKVDKNYLKSQSLKYPKMMTNLVENASKKQQDSIRYSNINNAIKNVLQPPVQSQTYRQSSNYNNISNYEKKCIIPYTIHQYSDKKCVEGFYGYIDCNRLINNKSVNDLKIK